MYAGFAATDNTPPLGTPLAGCLSSATRCAQRILDPLMLRAVWLKHSGEDVVMVSFEWCFMGREDADRFKGVLARQFGLLPHQILLTCTHTHAGPAVGTYDDQEYTAPLRDYLRWTERVLVQTVRQARATLQPVNMRVAKGKSSLLMNRRLLCDGRILNAPNPDGPVADALPVCLMENMNGEPVVHLFSVAAHPVAVRGAEVSADFPGLAAAELDRRLGQSCSMFLQGAAGDIRPKNLANQSGWLWDSDVRHAQGMAMALADEVTSIVGQEMRLVCPNLQCHLTELSWPLQKKDPVSLHAEQSLGELSEEKRTLLDRWLQRQQGLQAGYGSLSTHTSILLHGLRLGDGLQIVALEGEPVGAFGFAIEQAFGETTFAIGYSNGQGLYLVTTPMLREGGYEAESFWEYGMAAPLDFGGERVLMHSLGELRSVLSGDLDSTSDEISQAAESHPVLTK